jgi:hypothetical protein
MQKIILICALFIMAWTPKAWACFDYSPLGYSESEGIIDSDLLNQNRRYYFELILNTYHITQDVPDTRTPNFPYYETDCTTNHRMDLKYRILSHFQEPELYNRYQQGAKLFNESKYGASFNKADSTQSALEIFQALYQDIPPKPYSWAREASSYMIARAYLVLSQQNWDGYSTPDAVDQTLLNQAETAYKNYLEDYPKGLYAHSAHHIQRKIAYLKGDQEALTKAIKQDIFDDFSKPYDGIEPRYSPAISELRYIETPVLDMQQDHPFVILNMMFKGVSLSNQDLQILKSREGDFKDYPDLFDFTYALGLYQMKRYQDIISFTQDLPTTGSVMKSNIALIRAKAFLKTQNYAAHEDLLKTLIHEHPIDLGLQLQFIALKSQFEKNITAIIQKDAPNLNAELLAKTLEFGFTEADLEQSLLMTDIAPEKQTLLGQHLLRRYILTKQFAKADALLAAYSALKSSHPIDAIHNLSKNAKDPKSLLKLAQWIEDNTDNNNAEKIIYKNYLTDMDLALIKTFCVSCESYPKRYALYYPPIHFYTEAAQILKDTGQKSETEAALLSHIAKCGATHYVMACSWDKDSPKDQSKLAFQRLHKLYKDSEWAKKTPYYY